MHTSSARCDSEWVEVPTDQLPAWLSREQALVWIDISDPEEADFELLREQLPFHPLAIEDAQSPYQRPKVDFYHDYALIIFYAITSERREIRFHKVAFFAGPNYLVTVHNQPIEAIREVHDRWKDHDIRIADGTGGLLHVLLDTLLDDYFPALDRLAERLDRLEAGILERYEASILKEVLRMKRDLLALRRVAGPQRDLFNLLLRGESYLLPEETQPYWQDLFDHSMRVVESIDLYREMVTAMAEGFLTVQSNNINVVMQRLTIINLLFLPLAVLTGFFGMNFEMLPFDSTYLLQGALIAMIILPLSLFLWLRYKGWI